ncbi:MAG TPA: hypothetical protein DHV49_06110, partial [Alphaproteobacteria bacterium]|nr:hypothetical protein [Alphaproteobacteria bacterium]
LTGRHRGAHQFMGKRWRQNRKCLDGFFIGKGTCSTPYHGKGNNELSHEFLLICVKFSGLLRDHISMLGEKGFGCIGH